MGSLYLLNHNLPWKKCIIELFVPLVPTTTLDVFQWCLPFSFQVDICKRAVVNIMDPQMDDSDDSLSSSYAEPLPTALKRRTNRVGSSNKKRKSNVIEESDVDVDIITVDDDDFVKKVDKLTILPPTPPTSDGEGEGSG